ncbi:hypothetical protein [Streptomyces sp. NPDC127100]|uniref:hypothetical protein n=1 Tax=Streptomyces sp. NPDC127100 TaxID=3347138 RepID=UPI00364EC3ED
MEQAGSPTTPAAAIRRAAATAAGDVYHVVVAVPPALGFGAGEAGCLGVGFGFGARVTDDAGDLGGDAVPRAGGGTVPREAGAAERVGVALAREDGAAGELGVIFGVSPVSGAVVVLGGDGVRGGRGLVPAREDAADGAAVLRGVGAVVVLGRGAVGVVVRDRGAVGAALVPDRDGVGPALVRDRGGVGSRRGAVPVREDAGEGTGTAPGVRAADGATAPRERDAWSLAGAGGRGPAGVFGAGFEARGCLGRAVLDVSGVDDEDDGDGSGARVGRERSAEADGAGLGVPPFCATHAHTPTPPRTSTAAPPAIQGARRGGRR